MHHQRSRRPNLAGGGVLLAAIAVWLVGRYAAQPGMDWMRERASTEARIAWAVIAVAVAALVVGKCMALAYPPRDEDDDA